MYVVDGAGQAVEIPVQDQNALPLLDSTLAASVRLENELVSFHLENELGAGPQPQSLPYGFGYDDSTCTVNWNSMPHKRIVSVLRHPCLWISEWY